jgi:PHP family Zn ribbon phosphoesterase
LAAHAYLKHYTIYSASDAHDPGQIGTKYSLLRADVLDFEHLAMAFRKENGHTIVTA